MTSLGPRQAVRDARIVEAREMLLSRRHRMSRKELVTGDFVVFRKFERHQVIS